LMNGVPLENCAAGVPTSCGSGTRDVHWRESIFKTELMTGYISGPTNPLSSVTIGALADFGYNVNFAAADAYTIPVSSGFSFSEMAQTRQLNDRVTQPVRGLWR
jgi:hypothetical protein